MRALRAIALSVVVAALSSHSAAQSSSTLALLERYAGGEFAAVEAKLGEIENFKGLFKDLRHDDVKAWLAAGGPADRDRRELAAATFALEAARADEWYEWKWHQRQTTLGTAMGPGGASMSKLPVLYWMPPPVIIEWGCALLRQRETPRPIERIWQLAAMAVGQRSEDTQFLIGFTTIESTEPAPPEPPPAAPRPPSIPGMPGLVYRGGDRVPDEVLNVQKEIGHLNHVVDRFPAEKRFLLGQGLARERSSPADAIKVYNSLVGDPDVGGEASVRLGALYLRQGRVNDALQALTRAELLTRDTDLVYLAWFYRGQAMLRTRREADAITAFRGALAARPASQSASIALAALLAKRNQRTEAQALMKAVLDAGPDHGDPHIEYVHGDDRFWPELIARLHKEIKP